jgi:hypothetical protein
MSNFPAKFCPVERPSICLFDRILADIRSTNAALKSSMFGFILAENRSTIGGTEERICSLGLKSIIFCIFLTITIEILMLVSGTIYLTHNKWLGREGVDSWSMNLLGSRH